MKRLHYLFLIFAAASLLTGFSWEQDITTTLDGDTIGAGDSASCIVVLGEQTETGEVRFTEHDFTGDTTSGDATVTDSDTSSIQVGWIVEGSGIPAGATVAEITDETTFELSAPATATAGDVALTAIEGKHLGSGDLLTGDETVTGTDTFGLEAGWFVEGTGIPDDTTIESITSGSVFEMSNAATATNDDVSLTFIDPNTGRIVTNTDTSSLFVGMTGAGTIESIDSATQLTVESPITKTATEQDLTFRNDFDAVLVSIKVVGEASASTATVNFYATSASDANNFSTEAFNTESITGLGGETKIVTYRFSSYICPKAKIEVTNTTTESGETDDITATVIFAGYKSGGTAYE